MFAADDEALGVRGGRTGHIANADCGQVRHCANISCGTDSDTKQKQ